MAHSMDLRLRAVGLMAKGHTVLEISKLLDIGTATLWRWKARAKQDRLTPSYPTNRPAYKLDERAMLNWLSAHPDAYQHEIAQAMGVSRTAIQWAFKRLGITRKKRRHTTVSVMKSGVGNIQA